MSLSSCVLQQLSTVTLHFPAFLPEFSSSLQHHAEVVSWTAGQRGPFISLTWIVLYHFTFINFELVGVSHAYVSLWLYSLSCGIPIKLIIQTSYLQFVSIQIGILQIMDYGSVTKTILKLVEKSTVWKSTIKITIADNQNSFLDISLAARGERSVTSDGGTKQQTHYSPGSCYIPSVVTK